MLVLKILYIYYTKNAKAYYSVGMPMFKPTTLVDKRFNSICKKAQFIYFIWRIQLIKDNKGLGHEADN